MGIPGGEALAVLGGHPRGGAIGAAEDNRAMHLSRPTYRVSWRLN